MASPGPPPDKKKEESFLDKFGTLAKKKRNKQEIEELQNEGRNAIEAPLSSAPVDVNPEAFQLSEGEERSMVEPNSKVCRIFVKFFNTFALVGASSCYLFTVHE